MLIYMVVLWMVYQMSAPTWCVVIAWGSLIWSIIMIGVKVYKFGKNNA